MGNIVDRIGHRLTFLVAATILTVAANITLLLAKESDVWTPWFSMVLMGFAYTFTASTLWSGISLVVKKVQIGSAMAIVSAIQMLFQTIINLLIG
jgi:MFS family permease